MSSLQRPAGRRNARTYVDCGPGPEPTAARSPCRPRTAADLLACVRDALRRDDWGIAPGSIAGDSLVVIADGVTYRLSLGEGDTMDDAAWIAYTTRMELSRGERDRVDRDWMADTGADLAF